MLFLLTWIRFKARIYGELNFSAFDDVSYEFVGWISYYFVW
jgi:hypothetical protein